MVLGKLQVPGRPTIWIIGRQEPNALAVGAGGSCLDIFTFLYPFSLLSSSLWKTARYRLKDCLQRAAKLKTINQPIHYFYLSTDSKVYNGNRIRSFQFDTLSNRDENS